MPRRFELGLLSFGQGYEIESWSYFKAQPPYLPPWLLNIIIIIIISIMQWFVNGGAWKRQETYVRKPSYGGGTSHVHAAGVHHGTWLSNLSQATSRTPVSQERRGLIDYDILDKNQNFICHSENIPPMLKGIAFNGESKFQPKRDGLWHRKTTFRRLHFDLGKRYWILHIQWLLLFNILIVVGSC